MAKNTDSEVFFKSNIFGLIVIVDPGDPSDNHAGKKEVSFVPHQLKIEATGEINKFGLYKTSDPAEIDTLGENIDVEQIDEDTYNLLIEKGSRYIK